MAMILIFKSKTDAENAAKNIDDKAGLPSSSGKTTEAVSIIEKYTGDRWAIDVFQFQDRGWISEIKELADEVVSELSEDWFEVENNI
jgi:thymidine kinase